MTFRRRTIAVLTFVAMTCLADAHAQRRLPSPRRLSDSGSDVLDLERPVTAAAVPPKSVPSEIDRDKMRSLALFGQARLLYQRGEAAKALQAYQRAHHWNPDSGQPAAEVIPLAFYLQRPSVATRYALLAAERGKPNTQMMRQVAIHLVQDEKYKRADRLYRSILERMESAPRDYEWIVAHFEAGRLFFLREDFTAAADSFSIVLDGLDHPKRFKLDAEIIDQILGKPSLTYGLFGEAFLEANRLDRADRMFRKADELSTNQPLMAYHTARLAAKRGDRDSALRKLTEYFESNSTDAGTEPYEWLKKLRSEKDNGDDWLARLESLHKNQPNSALTDFLAEHYEAQNQPKRALQLYQQLNAEQMTSDSAQGIARMAVKTENVEVFLQTLGQVVDQTANIEALELGDNLKTKPSPLRGFAQRVLNVAKKTLLPPTTKTEREQLFGAGLLAIKAREQETGRVFINAALKNAGQRSRTAWQFSSGLEMFMEDDYQGAAKQFRTLLDSGMAKDPSTIEFYLATALELDGKNEEAIDVIDRAIERTPDSPLLESRKAWIVYHHGQNQKASQLYTAFLDKFGDDYSSDGLRDLVKDAKSSLSNLRLLLKDIDGAIEALQQILDEFPEDAGAMNDLGYLLADENRHLQRALRMTRFATERDPENNAYLDSLGWVLYRLEQYDAAAKYLRQAVAVDEPDGIILEHLGDVHDKMENVLEAKDAWNRALKAFDKKTEADRIAIVEKKIAALETKN